MIECGRNYEIKRYPMETILHISMIVLPILFCICLGVTARKKKIMTPEQIGGMPQFVIRFALPCVLFNSCLTAQMSVESLGSMAIAFAFTLVAALLGFRFRKKRLPYSNLPLLACSMETGMLGIPLTILLFGSGEAYRMGVLDLAQSFICIPVISILTADTGSSPSVKKLTKQVLTSPLLICSMTGLAMNLLGIRDVLDSIGILPIITECTGFLGEPISALMLFCVGYNFSFTKEDRSAIFKVSGAHLGLHLLFAGAAQLLLCLFPSVDPRTRWAMLLYFTLPGSYLSPALGKTEKDQQVLSSVCSLLTLFTILVFTVITVMTA